MIPFDNKHNNNNGLVLAPFLTLYGVSYLLIAWEQYKKANWLESEAVDVEKVLMKQFEAIYCG